MSQERAERGINAGVCLDDDAHNRLFSLAVETAGHAIYITDPQGVISYVNPEFERATGYAAAEAIGKTPRILKSGIMGAEYYMKLWEGILSGQSWAEEVINRRKDGSVYYALQTINSIKDDEGRIQGFVAIQSDITRSKELERELMLSESRYRSVLASMREGVIFQDARGAVVTINSAARRMLGLSAEGREREGTAPSSWIAIREDGSPYPASEHPSLLALKAGVQVDEAVMGIPKPDGDTLWLAVNARPVPGADGSIQGAVTSFVDISERKQKADAIRKAAESDFLTGLKNRYAMNKKLREELARAERYGEPLSALFLDIDFFKKVNDRYGHDTGDEVLRGVAAVIAANLRGSDLASRWGGEEFLIVAPHSDAADAAALAERIRSSIEAAIMGQAIRVTVSIGCSSYRKGDDIDALVNRADQALYGAKEGGRNRVRALA
jgi:diguanylate cyclase (GGDEF)-like protein/PAS domain S-box-containing protein